MLRLFKVGQQLRKRVTTVKVLGIPLFGYFESLRLLVLLLCLDNIGQRHGFRCQRLSLISGIHILQYDLHGGAVDNQMVKILEIVVVLLVVQQTDMEERSP